MVTVAKAAAAQAPEAEEVKEPSVMLLTRRLLVGGEVFEAGSPVPEGVTAPKSARKAD